MIQLGLAEAKASVKDVSVDQERRLYEQRRLETAVVTTVNDVVGD